MEVLGEFHRTIGPIILRHEGTIERFAGDGVMVFLGDPMPMKDHPCRSIRMALDLQKEMETKELQSLKGHRYFVRLCDAWYDRF